MGGVAGLATIFGLFGAAMYWLGKSNQKLTSLDDDMRDLKKEVKDISMKLFTFISARREEEKVGQDKNE